MFYVLLAECEECLVYTDCRLDGDRERKIEIEDMLGLVGIGKFTKLDSLLAQYSGTG